MENNPGLKILIVDDDKFLLDMYSIKFSEHGYQIETAFSGTEALAKIDQGYEPDICLVDIIMPEMDGFELVRRLKEKKPGAGYALVVLSNLGQKDDIDRALALGVDGYIVKASATPSEVVAKVKTIFENKKQKSAS